VNLSVIGATGFWKTVRSWNKKRPGHPQIQCQGAECLLLPALPAQTQSPCVVEVSPLSQSTVSEQGAWKVHGRFTLQRTLKWRIEPLPPQPLMLPASAALCAAQHSIRRPQTNIHCFLYCTSGVQLTALCSVWWQRCLDRPASKYLRYLLGSPVHPRLHPVSPKSDRHLHPSLCISSASVHPPTELDSELHSGTCRLQPLA
jgi:hypothetical protein